MIASGWQDQTYWRTAMVAVYDSGNMPRISVQLTACEQGLTWTYELNGIGEARASVSLGSLRCRARDRLEEHLPIELAGAAWSDSEWSTALGGVKLEIIYPKDRQALYPSAGVVSFADCSLHRHNNDTSGM
jgi:hypothetical protein